MADKLRLELESEGKLRNCINENGVYKTLDALTVEFAETGIRSDLGAKKSAETLLRSESKFASTLQRLKATLNEKIKDDWIRALTLRWILLEAEVVKSKSVLAFLKDSEIRLIETVLCANSDFYESDLKETLESVKSSKTGFFAPFLEDKTQM